MQMHVTQASKGPTAGIKPDAEPASTPPHHSLQASDEEASPYPSPVSGLHGVQLKDELDGVSLPASRHSQQEGRAGAVKQEGHMKTEDPWAEGKRPVANPHHSSLVQACVLLPCG